jgi:uncharacterized protein (DUF4415 family)
MTKRRAKDVDNPPLTTAQLARMRPAREVVPDIVRASRGRPRLGPPKQLVSLRIDTDVIGHFRRSGAGWQSRINSVLRKAAKLPAPKRAAHR